MPLSTWFWAAYLVASQTPGISAVQFQRQLGLKVHLHGQLADKFQHAHPLGEDDDLPAAVFGQQVADDPLQFLKLWAVPIVRVEDVGRVAGHAHAAEKKLQPIVLLLGERPSPGLVQQALHRLLVVLVSQALLARHGDEVVGHRAPGKLSFHVMLAPAQHDRLQAPAQIVQVFVIRWPTALVQHVVVTVETE